MLSRLTTWSGEVRKYGTVAGLLCKTCDPQTPTEKKARMTSYQTAVLSEYSVGFQEVARAIVENVERLIVGHLAHHNGSYSILPQTSKETAAKIILYEPHLGKQNGEHFPLRHPGVYILVRRNGAIGQHIWGGARCSPNLLERCEIQDIGVAPKHDESFRFFPVMAGESLDQIAGLLIEIAQL